MAEQKNNKKEGKSFIDKLLKPVLVIGSVLLVVGTAVLATAAIAVLTDIFFPVDNKNNTSQTGTSSNITDYEGCEIKGNISQTTGEKIYHLPDDRFYDKTEIDEASGEKYFCTEEEAENEGWRRSEV